MEFKEIDDSLEFPPDDELKSMSWILEWEKILSGNTEKYKETINEGAVWHLQYRNNSGINEDNWWKKVII